MGVFQGLVQPTGSEAALNGYRVKAGMEVDWKEQIARAGERSRVLVLAGGRRVGGETRGQGEPVPLERVPPLVFSEIMRDVDLFVGVSSVGNNPEWQDGGPENRYREYWWRYGFGELSGTAQTRRELLERLLPRLRIAGVCGLGERFLTVKGKLREYKIHLGSGNILMAPNDQYLRIVPTSRDDVGGIHLSFDGDRVLSIILSKAFMLAEDDRIADGSIVSQIRRRGPRPLRPRPPTGASAHSSAGSGEGVTPRRRLGGG